MARSMQDPFADNAALRGHARLAALRYSRRLPSAVVGECYHVELTDQPQVRRLAGTQLPPGMCFGDGDRVLSGLPEAAGTFVVEFEELQGGQVRRWVLEVADPPQPQIARTPLPAASVGVYFSASMRLCTPDATVIWSVCDGRLPPGLRLDAHSGRLYGVPTQAGVWCCSVRAQQGVRASLAPLALVVGARVSPCESARTPVASVLHEVRARHTTVGMVPG